MDIPTGVRKAQSMCSNVVCRSFHQILLINTQWLKPFGGGPGGDF